MFSFMASFLTSGCKIFIPAQANSNYRNSEHVKIELIDLANANDSTNFPNFAALYKDAFGKELPKEGGGRMAIALAAAPIAAAAVGMAVDYISKSLTNEASLYQAQFGDALADDKFLMRIDRVNDGKTNSYFTQHYYGFKVSRTLGDAADAPAVYSLTCGIHYTEDQRLFVVKPLSFNLSKAKAKIVGNGLLSWLVLYPHLFMQPDGKMSSTADFKFDGYVTDKNQTLQTIPMGAFSFKFTGYDIAHPKELTIGKGIPNHASGFLAVAPRSYGDGGSNLVMSDYAGNFTLTVNVTEADSSNVKQNLETLGQLVSSQKSQLLILTTNAVSGQ